MLTDSMTLDRLTPDDIVTARECLHRLLANDIAIGSWSDKTEVHQSGCSIHVKWANKVKVGLDLNDRSPANEFVVLILKSPDVLWSLLMKLFDVDDDDLANLREELADG